MKFRTWFKKQFGPRPKALSIEEVVSMEEAAKYQRLKLRERQRWDLQFDSCLKSWNVKL